MSGESKTTTDHQTIHRWVEERGGVPAAVKGTGRGDDPGILRIDFPGRGDDEAMEELSWHELFQKFEENKLAFVYQDKTADGDESRFNKFVRR